MKNSYLFTQPLMELDNELIQNLIRKEGLKGYGAYIVLNDALRKLDGFRMPLSYLLFIAMEAHTTVKYLLKIIKNYGLYKIEHFEVFSPELTDYMLKLMIEKYEKRENELQYKSGKKKCLIKSQVLKSVKLQISNRNNNLNCSELASLRVGTKINTISQFNLREREKEKREKAVEKTQKCDGGVRNNSQQPLMMAEAAVFSSATESVRLGGPLEIVKPFLRTHEIKLLVEQTPSLHKRCLLLHKQFVDPFEKCLGRHGAFSSLLPAYVSAGSMKYAVLGPPDYTIPIEIALSG